MVARDMLNQAAKKCPDSKIFISGYSQGGMISHNAIAYADEEARKHVAVSCTQGFFHFARLLTNLESGRCCLRRPIPRRTHQRILRSYHHILQRRRLRLHGQLRNRNRTSKLYRVYRHCRDQGIEEAWCVKERCFVYTQRKFNSRLIAMKVLLFLSPQWVYQFMPVLKLTLQL
jgi:hypothetical protein